MDAKKHIGVTIYKVSWPDPLLVILRWSHEFTGLLFIKQFPCFCTQTVDRIALKLCGWTHYGTPHAWLIFGHQWSSFPAFADNSSNCLRLAALWIPSLIKPPAWDVQCIHWCIVTYSWLAYSWVATHSQNTCFWLSGMITNISHPFIQLHLFIHGNMCNYNNSFRIQNNPKCHYLSPWRKYSMILRAAITI